MPAFFPGLILELPVSGVHEREKMTLPNSVTVRRRMAGLTNSLQRHASPRTLHVPHEGLPPSNLIFPHLHCSQLLSAFLPDAVSATWCHGAPVRHDVISSAGNIKQN